MKKYQMNKDDKTLINELSAVVYNIENGKLSVDDLFALVAAADEVRRAITD